MDRSPRANSDRPLPGRLAAESASAPVGGEADSRLRRFAAGGISAALLIASAVGYLAWYDAPPAWAAITFRTGVVIAALWLAWPQIHRLPRWAGLVTVVTVIAAIAFARRPLLALLAIAVILLAVWLWPKSRKGAR